MTDSFRKAKQVAAWRTHPVMRNFWRVKDRQDERRQAFDVLCSHATDRSGYLASMLPVELLDAIFMICIDRATLSDAPFPRGYRDRQRWTAGRQQSRQTLFACVLTCRSWSEPACRLIRKYVAVRTTTRARGDKVVKSLDGTDDGDWPRTAEIALPSPYHDYEDILECQCPCTSDCSHREAGECGTEFPAADWHWERDHEVHCALLASQYPRIPDRRLLGQMLELCSRLMRLVLVDVQTPWLVQGSAFFQALCGLKSLRDFTSISYVPFDVEIYPLLLENWRKIETVNLGDLALNDSQHRWDRGISSEIWVNLPTDRPRSQHLPRIRDLTFNFVHRVDLKLLDRYIRRRAPTVESLSLLGPIDERSRSLAVSTDDDERGIGKLPLHICSGLRRLRIDAAILEYDDDDDGFVGWPEQGFHRWLSRCVNLEELTLGPAPHLCEALLASIPASVTTFNYIFEHSLAYSRPSIGPAEAADLLCTSPSLRRRTYALNLQIPSEAYVDHGGTRARERDWTRTGIDSLVRRVKEECGQLGKITAFNEEDELVTLWERGKE